MSKTETKCYWQQLKPFKWESKIGRNSIEYMIDCDYTSSIKVYTSSLGVEAHLKDCKFEIGWIFRYDLNSRKKIRRIIQVFESIEQQLRRDEMNNQNTEDEKG